MGGNPAGMQRTGNMAPVNRGTDPFTGQPLVSRTGLEETVDKRGRPIPRLSLLRRGGEAALSSGVAQLGGSSGMVPGAGSGGLPRGPVFGE